MTIKTITHSYHCVIPEYTTIIILTTKYTCTSIYWNRYDVYFIVKIIITVYSGIAPYWDLNLIGILTLSKW